VLEIGHDKVGLELVKHRNHIRSRPCYIRESLLLKRYSLFMTGCIIKH